MSKKKELSILDDFVNEIKQQDFTLQELLSIQAAIFINYSIVAELAPAYLAKIPWPLRIMVWATFAVFWLTIAWAVTIIFELVVALPNMIIQIIRDEDGDLHDTHGNWEPDAWIEILKEIAGFFGIMLLLGCGRIALCFAALTDSFEWELCSDCDPSASV